jgi:PAS domain S-box-containing protein
MRWWPRTIRWQLLTGLLLLEVLSISLFSLLLVHRESSEIQARAQLRLDHDAKSLALQSTEALLRQQPGWIDLSVKMMGDSPTVAVAKITDPQGNLLFVSEGNENVAPLVPEERAQLPLAKRNGTVYVTLPGNRWEAFYPIYTGEVLRGYAWVEFDKRWMHEQIESLLRSTVIFGIIWMVASAALVLAMGRAFASPLALLHHGAASLMSARGDRSLFPLPVAIHNEVGDVIDTFNRVVASLDEQRAGLNDTLSLLDSMLANAPIGLAFVDRENRFVRVNQVFADLTGSSVSSHLGRTLSEMLPAPVTGEIAAAVESVFSTEDPVRNIELNGTGSKPNRPWTWLVSAYPVRTAQNHMRWVGIIVLDASERKRSEEALRRSEKLAVTGRLAASIAHEINNPLEAVTNLLFLLRNYSDLPEAAQNYAAMAEDEVRRIAEITQQTLRFYRQPTQPARVALSELLDPVLNIYRRRIHTLNLHIEKNFDPAMTLFCFAGEIRQVFANLVGNSIDASKAGGRLIVRARRSHDWKNPAKAGIRFALADTGAGMEPEVREHIFEAFFTTKDATGTGLGLWVSQEIVLKHQGLIRVRSRFAESNSNRDKKSGTVFQLFIPDQPAEPQEALNATPAEQAAEAKL